MPTPQNHIEKFLEYLAVQKRYSPHTITSYQNDLKAFFEFAQMEFDTGDPQSIKTAMIKTWLAGLMEQGITAKSVNRKISSLRSFYTYLLRQQIITQSPMTMVIAPKVPKKLPSFVEETDIKELWEHISFPEDYMGNTERLILRMLYITGMRRSELLQLTYTDISRPNNTIRILGKGKKERIIPAYPELLQEIEAHRQLKTSLGIPDNDLVICLENGQPMNPRKLYSIVTKYLGQITAMEYKGPHILRHSFATHLMNNGAEINAVKELLGHSSLASTQVYTHTNIEKLKEVFKQAHPKA